LANGLGLWGDGDEIGLLWDLEAAFRVRFEQAELSAVATAGDLYAVLRRHVLAAEPRGDACPTAMAFYRLKRTIASGWPTIELHPRAALGTLGRGAPKALQVALSDSDLRVPYFPLTGRGPALVSCAAVLLAISAICHLPLLSAAAALVSVAGVLLIQRDPRGWPQGCETVGDLARTLAAMNFGRLRAEGAGCRERDLWAAMIEVIGGHAVLPAGEIRLDTVLIDRR
jgi:hypothetical protein